MKFRSFVSIGLAIFFLGSCAKDNSLRVTTNTFANKEIIPHGFKKGSSFSISTKQKGDPLFTKEVSQKIATILKDKGFVVKANGDADYELNFSFGMEKSIHVRDVPVYIPDYGCWHYHSCHGCCGCGYGYRVAYVPEEYTLFNKILLIEVFKETGLVSKERIPVWQGTAQGYEENSDLRDGVDYLLITVFKNFGKNTQKYVKSRMEKNDESVTRLRQRYFQPVGYQEK